MTERRASRKRAVGRRSGSPTGAYRYPRTARVNQLLHEVIADELERFSEDDGRLGLMTVTGVQVDPDLRHAIVFLGSLPAEAAEALLAGRARLQAAIARQVHLKRTPMLSFAPDPAVATASRIEDIIRGLDGGGAGGADPAGGPDLAGGPDPAGGPSATGGADDPAGLPKGAP